MSSFWKLPNLVEEIRSQLAGLSTQLASIADALTKTQVPAGSAPLSVQEQAAADEFLQRRELSARAQGLVATLSVTFCLSAATIFANLDSNAPDDWTTAVQAAIAGTTVALAVVLLTQLGFIMRHSVSQNVAIRVLDRTGRGDILSIRSWRKAPLLLDTCIYLLLAVAAGIVACMLKAPSAGLGAAFGAVAVLFALFAVPHLLAAIWEWVSWKRVLAKWDESGASG